MQFSREPKYVRNTTAKISFLSFVNSTAMIFHTALHTYLCGFCFTVYSIKGISKVKGPQPRAERLQEIES